jgi:hypothetical protein
MKQWESEPQFDGWSISANHAGILRGFLVARRVGDPPGMAFFARASVSKGATEDGRQAAIKNARIYLDTFLDEDCTCTPQERCALHGYDTSMCRESFGAEETDL